MLAYGKKTFEVWGQMHCTDHQKICGSGSACHKDELPGTDAIQAELHKHGERKS